MKKSKKETVKKDVPCLVIHLRLKGTIAERVAAVGELVGAGSNNDAVRYLIARGLEACAGHVASQQLIADLRRSTSPQELLPILKDLIREDKL